MSIVNVNKVYLDKGTFTNNMNIVSVNANNTPFVNNDGSRAFSNCQNLTSVTNLSTTVSDLGGAFYKCSNLTNAPTIPASVRNTAVIITQRGYYNLDDDGSGMLYSKIFVDAEPTTGAVVNAYEYYEWEGEGSYYKMGTATIDNVDGINVTITLPYMGQMTLLRNTEADVIETFNVPKTNGIFQNCKNLVNPPQISNGVTNLQSAFAYCSKLASVPTLPDSVVNASHAFEWCENITSINGYGNNVQDMSGMFWGCSKVDSLPELPASVTDIGGAFAGMINLTNFPYVNDTVTSTCRNMMFQIDPKFVWDLNSPIVKSNVTYTQIVSNTPYVWLNYGDDYFYGYRVNSETNKPEEGAYIGYATSKINTNAYVVQWRDNNTNRQVTVTRNPSLDFLNIYDYSSYDYYDDSYDSSMACGAFESCMKLTDASNIGNLVSMDRMFCNCAGITNVKFPETVESMSGTFMGCRGLGSIPALPNSVTNISYAFYDCRSLNTTITIPDSVIDMSYAFASCKNLTDVTKYSNSATNMAGAFAGCQKLVNFPQKVPDSVTNLAACFRGIDSIVTAPELSNSATDLAYCFGNCIYLKNPPVIPNTAQNIAGMFYNCFNLRQMPNIPVGVTTMNSAFLNCEYIESIESEHVPNTVTGDMSSVFERCKRVHYMNNVTIPSGVTSLYMAFSYLGFTGGSAKITNLQVPSTITNMRNAFQGTHMYDSTIVVDSAYCDMTGAFYVATCSNVKLYIPLKSYGNTNSRTYNTVKVNMASGVTILDINTYNPA